MFTLTGVTSCQCFKLTCSIHEMINGKANWRFIDVADVISFGAHVVNVSEAVYRYTDASHKNHVGEVTWHIIDNYINLNCEMTDHINRIFQKKKKKKNILGLLSGEITFWRVKGEREKTHGLGFGEVYYCLGHIVWFRTSYHLSVMTDL